MAKSFTITTSAPDPLKADKNGHTDAVFTVTNATSRPIRGLAKPTALGDTKQEWLSLKGENERDFGAGETHDFTVSFNGPVSEPASGRTVPPATAATPSPARKYQFRLDMVPALKAQDEDSSQGPTVTVEMPAPPPPPNGDGPNWKLILLLILGGLLLIGIIVLVVVLLTRDKNGTNGEETPTPSPVESVSPTEKPSPTESIEDQCFKFAQERNQNLSPVLVRSLCKGTSNPQAPGDCARRAMSIRRPGVFLPSLGRVSPENAVSLCRGTNDADRVIACFQPKIIQGMSVAQAITACRPK